MRRALLACLICLAAASAGAAELPRASLEQMACQRASSALNRMVGITAVMRPLVGTRRMQLKFGLERRVASGQGFTDVQGRDLGNWLHPTAPATLGQRTDDVWRVQKEVVNLTAPAVYRFRVSFKWTGSSGHTLGRVVLRSRTCYQPSVGH
jgi:hypothetical protein